jgi:hypothetical protein
VHGETSSDDARLRTLGRAVEQGDEGAARALLAQAARTGAGARLADALAIERCAGRDVLGPLLPHEVPRVDEVFPRELVLDTAGFGWIAAEPRALMGAVLHVRVLELEHGGAAAPRSFAAWFGLHAALDVGGDVALERFGRVVENGPAWAAERAAVLLGSRESADAAVRLARVTLEATAEGRGRAYVALARGRVPIDDVARALLSEALERERPQLRKLSFLAFARAATDRELERLRREGPPDVRALAFLEIVARIHARTRGADRPIDLVRAALADPAPELRRAAVRVLSGEEWQRDPRAQNWLMGRLIDSDRAVRVEAARLLRRRTLPPKVAPRLRTIAEAAAPSLRPPIHRLADRAES